MVPNQSRRQYLTSAAVAAGIALAGCSDLSSDGSSPDDSSPGDETPSDDDTSTPTDGQSTVDDDNQTENAAGDGDASGAGPFDVRAVEDVTFDAEADRTRAYILDDPVADGVTLETESGYSNEVTTVSDALRYVGGVVDHDGDEVVVTATLDGEERTVWRERYPPSERAVERVDFEIDPPDSGREARARVVFTGAQDGDSISAESTVWGGEATISPAGPATELFVGIDPAGDEVIVRVDGDPVHRERYRPE